jgi:hypothetical protein
MRSIASVAMKPLFGVKPGRYYVALDNLDRRKPNERTSIGNLLFRKMIPNASSATDQTSRDL